jgi:hypothetical protein
MRTCELCGNNFVNYKEHFTKSHNEITITIYQNPDTEATIEGYYKGQELEIIETSYKNGVLTNMVAINSGLMLKYNAEHVLIIKSNDNSQILSVEECLAKHWTKPAYKHNVKIRYIFEQTEISDSEDPQ